MKALITGVNGQDGSYLSELLLEKGYQVFGLKRRSSSSNISRLNSVIGNANFHLVEGDITDSFSINDVMQKVRPTEVYNLAAQSHVATSFAQPAYTFQVNASGVLNILEAIRVLPEAERPRMYQASTSEMFGSNVLIDDGGYQYQNELTQLSPNSPYAVAKVASHELCSLYRRSYGIHVSSGILFNHECFKYDYPFVVRYNGKVYIEAIQDLALKFANFSNVDNKAGADVNGLEVWDKNGWTKVKCISWFKNKTKKLRYVNARNALYSISDDHVCILEDDKETKDVSVGDRVKTVDYPSITVTDSISVEEAELLGMLVGDGSLASSEHFTNSSEALRARFHELWHRVTGGDSSYYPSKSGFTGKIVGHLQLKGAGKLTEKFRSEIYTKCLDVFGHRYKKVPSSVLNGSKEVMEAFLVGYNNCDGLKANLARYRFKNFKTNSPVLAAGLLYLVSHVTGQKFNITLEESSKHGKRQFYYSLNFNSTRKTSSEKRKKVLELAGSCSQRQLQKQTGISRTFIRQTLAGVKCDTHNFKRTDNEIKKLTVLDYDGWFFDLETESGTLHAGLGKGVVHNSPRRGEEFVTRKITRWLGDFLQWSKSKPQFEQGPWWNVWDKQDWANRIYYAMHDNAGFPKLRLGNLDAVRDWSHAKDMVRGMWLMLQQDKPDDYVLASGNGHSVKHFLKAAFGIYNLNWEDYVVIDPAFYRPCEVPFLRGNAKKAFDVLGWFPTISFEGLVKEMVDADSV